MKPDTLIMSNGKVFIGKFQKIDKKTIILKTEYANKPFEIFKKQVKSITADGEYTVELENGDTYKGKIRVFNVGGELKILTPDSSLISLDSIQVINKMTAFQPVYKALLNGKVGLGYTLSRANNTEQFSFMSDVFFKEKKWKLAGSLDMYFSSIEDTIKAKRQDFETNYNYSITNTVFTTAGLKLYSSDVQKLKIRSTSSLGFGNSFPVSDNFSIDGALGGTWNHEEFKNGHLRIENSFEYYMAVSLKLLKNKLWEFSLKSTASRSTGIENRTRANIYTELVYFLTDDPKLNISTNFKNDFDSTPATGGSHSDYVLNVTFGYSF